MTTENDLRYHNDPEQEKDLLFQDKLLYGVSDKPPLPLTFLLGCQQFLVIISAQVTLPLLVMESICCDDSAAANVSRTHILGTVLVVAGIATLLQTTLGLRLPVFQCITLSYFIPTTIIMTTDRWKCPAPINLQLNASEFDNISVVYSNWTSSYQIFDKENNFTIDVDPNYHYYVDNDDEIVDSNELWKKRIREIQGGVMVCAFIQIVTGFSGLIGVIVRHVGPLTTAPILTAFLYAIIQMSIGQARSQWGISALFVALFVLFAMVLDKINIPIPIPRVRKRKCVTTKLPIFILFPIILSLVLTWLVCLVITAAGGFSDDPNDLSFRARTDTKPGVIANSPWFRIPYPLQWGTPTFSALGVIGMCTAILPGIFESLGCYTAIADITHERHPPSHAINRAVLMEGFGMFFAGFFGNSNSTTSALDAAIAMSVTRVVSRRIMVCTGIIVISAGLFTKFCSLFVGIPSPIIGGVLLGVIPMIGSVGIASMKTVDMSSSRNLFVFGFSLFIAMVASAYAETYPDDIDVGVTEVNRLINMILQIPMFVGGVVGFILDNILPGSRKSRGLIELDEANSPVYYLPFKTDFKWVKRLPIFPSYGGVKRDQNENEEEELNRLR